jgi:hypothetical protein
MGRLTRGRCVSESAGRSAAIRRSQQPKEKQNTLQPKTKPSRRRGADAPSSRSSSVSIGERYGVLGSSILRGLRAALMRSFSSRLPSSLRTERRARVSGGGGGR